MNQNPVQTVRATRVVPVIRLESPEQARPLAETLLRAELPIAEITFRTDAAEQAIRHIASSLPQMLVGAGTVLTPEQARRALDAGAQFAVSPGFNPRVVEFCLDHGLPIFPGVNSPTQVEQAMEYGLTLLKFFPAEASGGTAMLKALRGPYGNIRFIPTGGVSQANASSYLSLPNVAAVGGSWMVPSQALAEKDFDTIFRLASRAAELKEAGS